jgi:hypothetical protein
VSLAHVVPHDAVSGDEREFMLLLQPLLPAGLLSRGKVGRVYRREPGQALYEGKVQLTVTSDRRPNSGSVQRTLTGLEVIAPQSQVTVAGTWTCVPGPNLGPG